MTEKKTVTFESAMDELSQIVSKLEAGDLPLDKALEAFEKGSMLVKQCEKTLNDAELRVEKIEKQDN